MTDPRTRANREKAVRFIERLGTGVIDDDLLALLEFEGGTIELAKEYDDTRHSTETAGALLLGSARAAREEEEQ